MSNLNVVEELIRTSRKVSSVYEELSSKIDSLTIKPGDSFTINLNTAGYLTSSNTEMYFIVPFNKVIIANSVSLTNVTCITRQVTKYTHGSAASTRVAWDVVSLYLTANGIKVGLKRTTTTNSSNNSSIGIDFTGTFTFS